MQMSSSAPRAGVRGVARRAQQQRQPGPPCRAGPVSQSTPVAAAKAGSRRLPMLALSPTATAGAQQQKEKAHKSHARKAIHLYGLRRRMTACVKRWSGGIYVVVLFQHSTQQCDAKDCYRRRGVPPAGVARTAILAAAFVTGAPWKEKLTCGHYSSLRKGS